MNLKKGKFKIVEGTRVRMVSSKDTHIVEGAYGTVVSPGIRESEVRWDSMLAIRADYRYRNELEDALIIPVYNDLLDPSGNFQIWTPEPIARIYLDDCIKYIGEDTKDLKYGDLLCVYSMTLSEHSLYAIQLSNYKLHKLDTSACALQGCEDGPKIPKSKMGIIIKELKAMFPAADGKQIADLVKSCVV